MRVHAHARRHARTRTHARCPSQIAEAHPRFLRKQLTEVVQAMLAVAQAEALEDATRQLAAEFLVRLVCVWEG